jgi:hypothetical protein
MPHGGVKVVTPSWYSLVESKKNPVKKSQKIIPLFLTRE